MKNVKNEIYSFKFYNLKLSKKDVCGLIFSILGLIITNIMLFKTLKLAGAEGYKFIICDIIIIAIIIYNSVCLIINMIKSLEDRVLIEELELKNQGLLEVSDSMRAFKHDFNNIMQAIDGYIFVDDMESLKKYLKSLLKDSSQISLVDNLNNRIIENPAIYGVLLNKLNYARKNDIQLNVEVIENVKNLSEKSYIISRMLGILLDNALEASNDCEEKVVNIQFLKENHSSSIIIENTYVDQNIDTSKIFEKNFTTKKEKGNSGLGLWKVNDILSKDSSFELFTTKDGTMFKQKLEICAE